MTSQSSCSPAHPIADDAALRRRMIALARRWLGDSTDAEDLVQDAYLRTANGELPPGEGAQAWLFTVLRNLCMDKLRRRGRLAALQQQIMALESSGQPANQAQEVDAALRHLSAHLAPEDAAAVLLHEVFSMGHAQLGAYAGRSAAASRQRLHRALRRLRNAGPAEIHTAEEETVLQLCRFAMARHDPAGLLALLRVAPPVALAACASLAADGSLPTAASPAQLRWVNGRLVLAVHLGTQFLCLLPLGSGALAEPAALA